MSLDDRLKFDVFERDVHRCRWCGQQRSWLGFDAHHIEYRRGTAYDTIDNLITLCRPCHNFVHDSFRIPKGVAQAILSELTEVPVLTGLASWRRIKAAENPMSKKITGDSEGSVGRVLG